jgi:hypothetical protein
MRSSQKSLFSNFWGKRAALPALFLEKSILNQSNAQKTQCRADVKQRRMRPKTVTHGGEAAPHELEMRRE